MFDFKNKIAVVTGGARGIGKCIREEFEKAGATVLVIDLLPNDYFVGDLADKATLERFAEKVIAEYGRVDYLINNAAPRMCGIEDCTYEDFENALRVGVTAPFFLYNISEESFHFFTTDIPWLLSRKSYHKMRNLASLKGNFYEGKRNFCKILHP